MSPRSYLGRLGSHAAGLWAAGFGRDDFVGAAGELDEQRAGVAGVDDLLDAERLGGEDGVAQGSEVGLQLFAELVGVVPPPGAGVCRRPRLRLRSAASPIRRRARRSEGSSACGSSGRLRRRQTPSAR